MWKWRLTGLRQKESAHAKHVERLWKLFEQRLPSSKLSSSSAWTAVVRARVAMKAKSRIADLFIVYRRSNGSVWVKKRSFPELPRSFLIVNARGLLYWLFSSPRKRLVVEISPKLRGQTLDKGWLFIVFVRDEMSVDECKCWKTPFLSLAFIFSREEPSDE